MSKYSEKKPFGIVSVKFIQKPGYSLSSKTYDYLVNEWMYSYFYARATEGGFFNKFTITNDKGYNYRDNEVIVVKMTRDLSGMQERSMCFIESAVVSNNIFASAELFCKATYDAPVDNSVITADNITIHVTGLKDVNEKEERGNNMFKNVMKDIKFGRVEDGSVKMSIYGPAFITRDGYYAYDKKTEKYVDVTDMLLDIDNFCYMVPVAKNEVKRGDFIFHNDLWVRITDFNDKGYPVVEDMYRKEVTTILPTKNIFGFDFYTKLISYADNMLNATSDNPFGTLLPLMMLNEGTTDKNSLLPMMMLMNGGQFNGTFDMSNPMVMFMMLNDKNSDNSFKDLMMFNMLSTMTNKPVVEVKKEVNTEKGEED